jgi:hypothetical protein
MIAGNFTSAGMQGLHGTFFDLDMLPINAGYWDPNKHKHGPPYDAPRGQSLITLWTIARSPLFLTELPPFDETTLSYLQNTLAMRINEKGRDTRVVGYQGNCSCKLSHGVPGECGIAGGKPHALQLPTCVMTWAAEVDLVEDSSSGVAVALLNLAENATQAPAKVSFAALGLAADVPRKVTNIWTGDVLFSGAEEGFEYHLPGHGSLLALVE